MINKFLFTIICASFLAFFSCGKQHEHDASCNHCEECVCEDCPCDQEGPCESPDCPCDCEHGENHNGDQQNGGCDGGVCPHP